MSYLLQDMFGESCSLMYNTKVLSLPKVQVEVSLGKHSREVFFRKKERTRHFFCTSTLRCPELTVLNPDFGTFRSWLQNIPDDGLEEGYATLIAIIKSSTVLDHDYMEPFREYTVAWLVVTLRKILEKDFKMSGLAAI